MHLLVWSNLQRSYIFQVLSKSVQVFWSHWGRNLAILIRPTFAVGFYNILYYRYLK